jgi:hypothetical protein
MDCLLSRDFLLFFFNFKIKQCFKPFTPVLKTFMSFHMAQCHMTCTCLKVPFKVDDPN